MDSWARKMEYILPNELKKILAKNGVGRLPTRRVQIIKFSLYYLEINIIEISKSCNRSKLEKNPEDFKHSNILRLLMQICFENTQQCWTG